MKIAIDSAGRVVIPKPLREAAGLAPGDEMEVRYRDGKIEIEPTAAPVKFKRKGGLLVASRPRGAALTHRQVNGTLQEIREGRG